MDLGIKSKKAIVCASSKGLGKACAELLAADGVDLVLRARRGSAGKDRPPAGPHPSDFRDEGRMVRLPPTTKASVEERDEGSLV